MNKKSPEENITAAEPPYDPWKDMVAIKIPNDRNNNAPIPVMVNGRGYTLKRGVRIEVPRPIYDLLVDQEMNQAAQDAFIDANEIKPIGD